ncbi:MAG: calcium-binding protein [Planctomycetes bacterium]|nr:calcium-binding protein [Planctomycetota bacterium]
MTKEIKTLKPFVEDLEVGNPVGHQNLTLIPLRGEENDRLDYILAAEAIEEVKLIITEIDESGNVPELMVTSTADNMILLLDGEELVGAKQNRILNTTILLPAKVHDMKIPVSCVEQGRWSYRSHKFVSGNYTPAFLRACKSRSVHKNLCEVGRPESDQNEVWAAVDCLVEEAEVSSSTSAMKDVVDQRQETLENYVEALPYPEGTRGVIVAINGKFVALDLLDKSTAIAGAPQDALRYVDQANRVHGYLYDVNHLVNDFDFTIFKAQHQVITAILQDAKANNPNGKPLKAKDRIDPDYHDLNLNNDIVWAGSGDDLVIGDDGTVITAILDQNSANSANADTDVNKDILSSTDSYLSQTADQYKTDLSDHNDQHHNVKNLKLKKRQLKFIAHDYEYDKNINNNTIYGQEDSDLILGNLGVFTIPIVPANSTADTETINNDIDKILKNAGNFVTEQYQSQYRRNYQPLHHTDYTNRGGSSDKIVLTAGNDNIIGGAGADFILGDSTSVTTSYLAANPDNPIDSTSGQFEITNLEIKKRMRHVNQFIDPKLSVLESDTIDGGPGSYILYGQWGNDNLNGTAEGNVVFGGSGKDTIAANIGFSRAKGQDLPTGEYCDILSDNLFYSMDPLRRLLLDLPAENTQTNALAFSALIGNRLHAENLEIPSQTSLGQTSFQLSSGGSEDTYVPLLSTGNVPEYVEVQSETIIQKASSGTLTNSYFVFDYQDENNFKFAGISAKSNRLKIGHRNADNWIVDATIRKNVKTGKNYTLRLCLNNNTASLVHNNKKILSYNFAGPLNTGAFGLGAHNSNTDFENVEILTFPDNI